MDKGIEFDENPIRLDYDGWMDGRITVDKDAMYTITFDDKEKSVVKGKDLTDTLAA